MHSLARHHQLHGVQPVLPVPEVDAAVEWFCRVLGFSLDFAHGTPAAYARVHVGDRTWGDPIYIHLSKADAPIQPCGEIRLHVGHDIDALHAFVLSQGGEVDGPPEDQPWGLREFTLQAPGGHRLVLGAEIGPQPDSDLARTVIACYRPKPGQAAALRDLVRSHVPTLRRLGLATDRAPTPMLAADGTLVEVFEWSSRQAIEDAHQHPEVLALWAAFGAVCDTVRLADLAESQQLFAEFTPIDRVE